MKSTLIWVVRFVFKHTSSIMALDSDTSFLHFVWRRISELAYFAILEEDFCLKVYDIPPRGVCE